MSLRPRPQPTTESLDPELRRSLSQFMRRLISADEATRRQARSLLHGPTIQPILGFLIDRLVALLRGRDDDQGQRAREALVAVGPTAVPALLAALWASRRRAAVSMRVAGVLAEIAPVVPERESLLMVAYLNSFTICSGEEVIRGACRQVLAVLQSEHQRRFAAWSQTDDAAHTADERS